MSVQITSTTDSEADVLEATGNAQASKAKVEDKLSASAPQEQDENVEASETSEVEDNEENEAKGEESEDESEKDESEEKPEDKKPKKKGGIQKRIGKLTSKLSAKEQEAEYWKSEFLKTQKSKEAEKSAPAQNESAISEGKPKAEDFESHEAYVEALADWKFEQKDKERETKQRQESVKAEYDQRVSQHLERVSAFAEAHDDFEDALEDVDDIPMSVAVQDAILSSDKSAELMYELAKNRKEYERICSLSPVAAAREIGKFEAKMKSSETSQESKQTPIKTTQAPPPLKTVSSKGSGTTSRSPDEMNFQEYKKWRAAHPNG